MRFNLKLVSLILAIACLSPALTGCTSVPSGSVGVKTVWGVAQSQPVSPGLQWQTPLADYITTYDSRTQTVPEEFAALTKDGQSVKITGVLNYRINALHAPLIYSDVSQDVAGVKDKVVQPILLSVIKQVASQSTMTELIAGQLKFSDSVETELRSRLTDEKIGNIPKGDIAIVDSFNITGFVLDPNVQEAIEKTAISRQLLQTATNDVEVAKLQAQRNAELQKGLTAEILLNDAIKKWDGSGIPPTVGGSAQFLIQPTAKAK
jgi:regulator of protease activity HflC (stomatin/prohibitin superfamily)